MCEGGLCFHPADLKGSDSLSEIVAIALQQCELGHQVAKCALLASVPAPQIVGAQQLMLDHFHRLGHGSTLLKPLWGYADSVPNSSALTAYAARAAEYSQELGTLEAVYPEDRQLVRDWAQSCTGKILDVGCGPGHWTDFLRADGHDVEGLDPVPEFIAIAQSRFPLAGFREASAEQLGANDGEAAGILAWYSLIHTAPGNIGHALAEFARALRPGGSLLVGFFEWPQLTAFDHKVVTAYRWPVDELSARAAAAGFTVESTATRRDSGTRPHAAIIARRSGRTRGPSPGD